MAIAAPARAAPAMPSALRFSLVSDAAGLRQIAPAWEDLLRRSSADEPMLSPTWLIPWWDVYGQGRSCRLCVGLFHDGDRLVGLAPLQRRYYWHRFGMPYLELEPLGASADQPDGVCSEYLNLIFEKGREEHVAAGFIDALRAGRFGRWHVLQIPMMDGSHPLHALLGEAARRVGFRVETQALGEAPYIPLPATWDAYVKGLGRHRRFLTKSVRDFDTWADGGAQVRRAATPAELDEGKRVLHQLHAERWQALGQSGVFHAERFRTFHDRVMADLFAQEALELVWLSVRDQPVAAVYNIRWNGKIHFYQSGRSLAVPGHLRPGIVLHAHCIRAAIEAGCREYDFLGTAVQYKRQLASATRPLVQLRIGGAHWREDIRQAYLRGRGIARALYRWWRPVRSTLSPEPVAPG